MTSRSDTIAALATAPGRGGVAVVRVSGEEAWRVAERVTGRRVTAADAGRFFRVPLADADEGLLLVFKAPRSYTGEDVVEFQGHGGSVAPRRVLEACLAAGARLAERGEFTLRAFLNGRIALSAAEGVIDLVDARTARAADEAFARLKGDLQQPFEEIYGRALDLSSRLEHALDFDEGELPESFNRETAADLNALEGRIARLLATAREGRLLREGVRVVLAGAPNAGKSSLMNALLGSARAIVNATPGTTRDTIEEGLVIDGWAVRLCDTAGLRATADGVEAEGIRRAEELIRAADIVVALDCDLDGAMKVHAKCDLDRPGRPREAGVLNLSAKTGEGLEAFRRALAEKIASLAARGDETAGADVTTQQGEILRRARAALEATYRAPDGVAAANGVRTAAEELGRLVGKTYSADLLTALFSRFCVGK